MGYLFQRKRAEQRSEVKIGSKLKIIFLCWFGQLCKRRRRNNFAENRIFNFNFESVFTVSFNFLMHYRYTHFGISPFVVCI